MSSAFYCKTPNILCYTLSDILTLHHNEKRSYFNHQVKVATDTKYTKQYFAWLIKTFCLIVSTGSEQDKTKILNKKNENLLS